MNYYPFHLGDYAAHTQHLEPMEDLAYRRLIDLYYLTESPLPLDVPELARRVRLRSEIAAIETVLNEFFTATEDGWYHERCADEVARMQDKQAKARASAEASVRARQAKADPSGSGRSTDAQRPLNDRSTDVELPTPTPTPSTTSLRSVGSAKAAQRPDDVPADVWAQFLTIRKAKRAPLTDLALKGLIREAAKANVTLTQVLTICCERGWQSFRHDWEWQRPSNGRKPAPDKFDQIDYGEVRDL